MGKIIRYCKLTEDHVGDNAFDVSRTNILGNPYTHIKERQTKAQVKVKTREDAIEYYKEYFRRMMASKDKEAIPFQTEPFLFRRNSEELLMPIRNMMWYI